MRRTRARTYDPCLTDYPAYILLMGVEGSMV